MTSYKGLCLSKLFKYTVFFFGMLNIFYFKLNISMLAAGFADIV